MKAGVQKFLVAAAAVVVFAGPASAQSPAVSDDVVKIGVLTDMSGQFSHESGEGAVTAVKMAVEDAGGKVLGKPVEVLVADHQNKPDLASAKATEWFDREHLDALMDVAASSTALAAQDVAKQRNRIIILN